MLALGHALTSGPRSRFQNLVQPAGHSGVPTGDRRERDSGHGALLVHFATNYSDNRRYAMTLGSP